jgi:5S rRNA maturation endonuclease (ribonuclease M5)
MTDFTFTSAQCREYFQSRMPDARITERESSVVKCPFHDDRTASLSLNFRKGVWNCFAGCGKGGLVAFEEKIKGITHPEANERVREALNLNAGHSRETPEAIYTYRDAASKEVFQKLRYPGKKFVIRRKTETGYENGLGNMEEKPLYGMENLVRSNVVFVVEGERDCDTLTELLKTKPSASHAYAATCNFDGAGKWRDAYSKYFSGKMVFILADNDEPGRKHAAMVAESVASYAYQVRIVELKGLADKGDVSDYLEDHTITELFEEIKATVPWKHGVRGPARVFVPALEFMATRQGEDIDWMIEGILERGANGVIVAEPKVGKSWIAIDLALSLAMGSDFLDYRVRMPVKTAILSREDNPGLTQWRMKHLMRGKHKPQNLDIDQTLMVNTRAQTQQFSLMNDIHLDEVCRSLESFRPEICFLDVFKVLHPVDENDNTEMHKVMERLSLIQSRVGCSMALVHHSRKAADGKDDISLALRMRGASAIAGWAEWIIGLTRVRSNSEELNIRKFEVISKATAEIDPIFFAIESSDDKSIVKLRRCEFEHFGMDKEKRQRRSI